MSISWTLTYIFLTNTLYTPILSQFQPFPASRYKVHKNLRQQTYLFCRRRCIDSLLIQRDDSDTTFRRTTFHIQWGNPIGSNAGPIRTIRQPPQKVIDSKWVIFEYNGCISAEKYLILSVLALPS